MRNHHNNSSRLEGIDSCRGIAALLVVMAHTGDTVTKGKYFGHFYCDSAFDFGVRGVDFFFVLSGFVIAYAHWSDIGISSRLTPYITKRIVRIYPPLWAVAIPLLIAALLFHLDIPGLDSWENIFAVTLTTLTLAPSEYPPVPGVAWSLKHEIMFYLLYGVLIWRRNLGLLLFGAWCTVCIIRLYVGNATDWKTDFITSPYNIEFCVGIVAGVILRKYNIRSPVAVALAGVAGFLLGGLCLNIVGRADAMPWEQNPITGWELFVFGFSSMLMVIGIGQLDQGKTVSPPSIIMLLGAASYSIYLVHYPVVSVSCKVLKTIDRYVAISPQIAYIIVPCVAIAAGVAFHLFIEKRVVFYARRAASAMAGVNIEKTDPPAVGHKQHP
jgi:peptidoglycan/LPS O-acetylase OafA/YrhL